MFKLFWVNLNFCKPFSLLSLSFAPDPCQHLSRCEDGVASFSCACLPGYSGALCEADVNECASAPCRHGAFCLDHTDYFTCSCRPGFTYVLRGISQRPRGTFV